MKRLLALLMAVMMLAAVFAACGEEKKEDSGSGNANSQDAAASVDLSEILNTVNDTYNISESTVKGLKKVEGADALDRYYMISADTVKQFAAERSSSSDNFTEIVLIEVKDASDVDQVVTKLNSRLDSQRNTAKSYSPESSEMLEGCEVKTNGNFVYMVIDEKQADIVKTIEEQLNK